MTEKDTSYISTCTETADFSLLQIGEADIYPDEWSPCGDNEEHYALQIQCGCAHPMCNGKEKHLHNGLKRAAEVFAERKKTFEKTTDRVTHINKHVGAAGAFLSVMGLPAVGLPVLAVSAGVQFVNHLAERANAKRFDKAYAALHVCENEKTGFQDKCAAYGMLKKTATQVRYWENTEYVGSTVVKFVVGEAMLALDMVLAIWETKGELEKRRHPQKTGSTKLTGALGEIHKGLGLVKHNRGQSIAGSASTPS